MTGSSESDVLPPPEASDALVNAPFVVFWTLDENQEALETASKAAEGPSVATSMELRPPLGDNSFAAISFPEPILPTVGLPGAKPIDLFIPLGRLVMFSSSVFPVSESVDPMPIEWLRPILGRKDEFPFIAHVSLSRPN
jgi:hypothetical protein